MTGSLTSFRVLDVYCGGWGAAYGYYSAGATEVVGVDIVRRRDVPDGPFTFIKADALDVLADTAFVRTFDLVHASPPCKVHTRLGHLMDAQGASPIHGDLVPQTRTLLEAAGVPAIIENVEGAPVRPDVVLCGSMFGLALRDAGTPQTRLPGHRWLKRHRLFELVGWPSQPLLLPECQHPTRRRGRPIGVYGSLGDQVPGGGEIVRTLAEGRAIMGMPWASWASLTQAIPPAYTHWLASEYLDITARTGAA